MSQSSDRGNSDPVILLILAFGGFLIFPCILAALLLLLAGYLISLQTNGYSGSV